MPVELEGLESPKLIEYRKLKIGEKPGKVPSKTPFRVLKPLRDWKAKRFPMDEMYMRQAAVQQNLQEPGKAWTKLQRLLVYAVSDMAMGDNGVVFVERALYTGRGRWCGSRAGEETARQKIDVGAYARDKKIVELGKPQDVKCTSKCPLWGGAGKKSDCKWRCIANFQLVGQETFPGPARFRSTSLNTIRALVTSLNFVGHVTQGVLMGIPLWLTRSEIDTHDATGELRRIPVVHIEFTGTLQKLRGHAVREIESRNMLKDALGGRVREETKPPSFIGDDQEIDYASVDLDAEPEDDDSSSDNGETASGDIETQSRVALLYKKLEWPQQRQRMLEEKHEGDLNAVLGELQTLSPDFNPSPGEPGNEVTEVEPEAEAKGDDDDFMNDDMFD